MKYAHFLIILLLAPSSFGQRSECGNRVDNLIKKGNDIAFSHTDSSFQYFEKAIEMAEFCSDSVGIAKTENCIGLYYSLTGNYDEAAQHYFLSLEIANRNNLQKDEGIVKNNLGVMYFELGELEKSRNYYNEALSLMQALQDTMWLGKIYGNLAGVHFMDEEYDASILTLEKSIYYASLAKRYESVGGAIANLAMVKIAIGETESAFESFDEGIHLLDSVGDKRGVATTLIEKAKSQFTLGRTKEALNSYEEAQVYAEEVFHALSITQIYKGKTEIYQSLGNYELALATSQKLLDFQDSVLLVEKYQISLDLEEKYQNKQNDLKISFLEEQDELSKEVAAEQENVAKILITLVVILLLFFGFIFYQWFRKKKTNEILQSQNERIEQSLAEREVLIREVHHRVKNNLQIVSGMLNIQANSGVDDKTKEALLDNRKRVQSMAIVHQKLYQHKDINEVHLKEYLSHLIDEVESQNDSEIDIEIEQSIEDLSLPIDLTIPLGLILTEVLSNSFKHAFKNKASGQIKISLKREASNYFLKVQDDGLGFKENEMRSDAFGTKLIQSLSKSISAKSSWENLDGTIFSLTFTHE
ncbi:MAG: two-component sensor histidine kinase [Arenicella sp.]|jgi:two-component sensor histidine kinase